VSSATHPPTRSEATANEISALQGRLQSPTPSSSSSSQWASESDLDEAKLADEALCFGARVAFRLGSSFLSVQDDPSQRRLLTRGRAYSEAGPRAGRRPSRRRRRFHSTIESLSDDEGDARAVGLEAADGLPSSRAWFRLRNPADADDRGLITHGSKVFPQASPRNPAHRRLRSSWRRRAFWWRRWAAS
jgi:hypothetical protein